MQCCQSQTRIHDQYTQYLLALPELQGHTFYSDCHKLLPCRTLKTTNTLIRKCCEYQTGMCVLDTGSPHNNVLYNTSTVLFVRIVHQFLEAEHHFKRYVYPNSEEVSSQLTICMTKLYIQVHIMRMYMYMYMCTHTHAVLPQASLSTSHYFSAHHLGARHQHYVLQGRGSL